MLFIYYVCCILYLVMESCGDLADPLWTGTKGAKSGALMRKAELGVHSLMEALSCVLYRCLISGTLDVENAFSSQVSPFRPPSHLVPGLPANVFM
jgi:hypothetical protein